MSEDNGTDAFDGLGAMLHDLREERTLSLRELARASGGEVTAQAISRLERGERLPNMQTLQALARGLGVRFCICPDGIVAEPVKHVYVSARKQRERR